MFDIGWSELLIIGIVALIAIGPKELPSVLRTVGQYMAKVRRMASEFQGQFQEAMREAEMADLKKEVDEMAEAASDLTDFNPLDDVQKEIESAIEDKPHEAAAPPAGTPASTTDSASPEAAAPAAPAPVSSEFSIPSPAPEGATGEADLAVAPEAPQPKNEPEKNEAKTGSGA